MIPDGTTRFLPKAILGLPARFVVGHLLSPHRMSAERTAEAQPVSSCLR